MKKYLTLALLILILSILTGTAFSESFRDKLLSLPDVVSVDEIIQIKSGDKTPFAEKYLVIFEQPLDWNGATSETFTQRIEIGFNGYDNVNVMQVHGYELNDEYFTTDDRHELVKKFDGNFINVEYRFFKKSAPKNLSRESTALWEYLNDENASNDFHNIIRELKEILSGSWIFTGTSKGGQATNVFAYYFPNDVNAYVAYIAPFCDGTNDKRMYEAIYNTIGNERYGETKAKEYRDLMLDFQVEAIKNRDYLQPVVWNLISEDERILKNNSGLTSSDVYENYLTDYNVGVWQYDQDFASIEKLMKLPRTDDPSTDVKENEEFLEGISDLFQKDLEDYNVDLLFPYLYQAATENGNYGLSIKYLREAVEKAGLSLNLTDEKAINFTFKAEFTQEQLKAFTFNPEMRNKMLEWTKTNTSNVIMIYGDSDPWYFVRLPETDNKNIHVFVSSKAAHGVKIDDMTDSDKNEIMSLLNSWLKKDISSSGGGCNFGFSVLGLLVMLFNLSVSSRHLPLLRGDKKFHIHKASPR